MQDKNGIYYFPDPPNRDVRVYVRKNVDGDIEYRLWEAHHPEVWEQHQWLSQGVIKRASEIYRKERDPHANPLLLYDEKVARALLAEIKEKNGNK